VRIKLSSIIVGGYVNLGLVDEANDLYVVRSLDVLDTLKSGGRDEACAMAGFGAPSDFLTFGVTDGRVRHWRSPQAEVIDVIDKRRLAHGLLVLSGGVANVVAYLRATDGGGVVVDLVRDS
jgi:hypothetical protein